MVGYSRFCRWIVVWRPTGDFFHTIVCTCVKTIVYDIYMLGISIRYGWLLGISIIPTMDCIEVVCGVPMDNETMSFTTTTTTNKQINSNEDVILSSVMTFRLLCLCVERSRLWQMLSCGIGKFQCGWRQYRLLNKNKEEKMLTKCEKLKSYYNQGDQCIIWEHSASGGAIVVVEYWSLSNTTSLFSFGKINPLSLILESLQTSQN